MNIAAYIGVMAGVTYLVRAVPLVLFRKKIKSRFLKDLLYYVPYAVLGAMTVPAALYSTGSIISAVAGLIAAVLFAFRDKGLLTVAVAAALAALACELLINLN